MILNVNEHDLTVDLVETIHSHSKQITLIIIARNQSLLPGSFVAGSTTDIAFLWFLNYTHVVNLRRESQLVDKVRWRWVPDVSFILLVLFDELLAEVDNLTCV